MLFSKSGPDEESNDILSLSQGSGSIKSLQGQPEQVAVLLSPFIGSDIPIYASLLAWYIVWHQKV